jgi:hypothetical protein
MRDEPANRKISGASTVISGPRSAFHKRSLPASLRTENEKAGVPLLCSALIVRSSGTDETISKCRTLRSLARRRRLVSEGVE